MLLIGNGSCGTLNENRLTTLTLATNETTHTLDMSTVARTRVLAFELQPQSLDTTEYFLDDLRLLP